MSVDMVVNTNGVDVADVGDSEVLIGIDEDVEDEVISEVLSGNTDPLYDAAERVIKVSELLRIAEVAEAVLDSTGGGYSLAQLALVVKAAGGTDFTDQYADEIAALAGEGQS